MNSWDVELLQQRFLRRQVDAERDVEQLRKKAKTNESYKGFHDRQIGAMQAFIFLATTDALMSRDALVRKLQTMREEGPFETTGAFDENKVTLGWNETLDSLIKEFSNQ